MSEFSPATSNALDSFLPELAHKANPVDLTGQIYSIPNSSAGPATPSAPIRAPKRW